VGFSCIVKERIAPTSKQTFFQHLQLLSHGWAELNDNKEQEKMLT
jgi:hypothetical protein